VKIWRESKELFSYLNPKERAAYVALFVLFIGFTVYVGSRHMHEPIPLVVEEKSPPRTGSDPPPAKTTNHEAKSEVVVHVVGAVAHEGVFHLSTESRVQDAIHAA
jgi:hypothetical protein